LLRKGGEKALSMRAVARAAGTTTPTVYERFRDKRDLLDRLRRRAQQDLFSSLKTAATLTELPQRYLEFVLKHPHEYELIHVDWAARVTRDEPRPGFELLKKRLSERLGGTPEQHERLGLALLELAHGAAMALLTKGIAASASRELRSACVKGFGALIEHAATQSKAAN
jgi:AcrR family transcriptional regulator